jgi:hypothetical protein
VSHLCSDSESGCAEKQDSNNKTQIYAAWGGGWTVTLQEQVIIPTLKFFLEKI